MRLKIKLPSHDFIEHEFLLLSSTTVQDIIEFLPPKDLLGCGIQRICVVYRGNEVTLDSKAIDHGFKSDDTLEIIIKVNMGGSVVPEEVEYSNFVRLVSPHNECDDVGIDSHIQVEFGPSKHGLRIHTPSLVFCDSLKTCVPHGGDMIRQLGRRAAFNRAYIAHTNHHIPSHRILLLKVDTQDPLFDERFESVRYTWSGANRGYTGGDSNSWQRYTKWLPIECRFVEEREWETEISTIKLQPFAPLEHGTHYAILLCNNVPTGDGQATFSHHHTLIPTCFLLVHMPLCLSRFSQYRWMS